MKKFLIALLLAGVALAGRAQITPATALSINLGTRNLQNSQGDALGFNVPGNWPAVFLSGSSLTFNSGSTLTVNSGATVSGLVSQLVAGSGITLSPSGGQGVVTVSASGGLPGGSNTQLQYNNSGVFGGTSGLTWSGTGLALAASGAISVFDLSNANVGGDSLIRFTNDQGARLYSAVLGSTFAGTTAGISNNNLALITTSQTGGTYPSALMFGTGNGAPVYLMANNTNYIKLDGAGNTSLPLLTTNGVVTTNSGIGNLASTTSLSGIAVSGAAGSFTTLSASSTVSGTGFSTYLASPPAIGGTAPSTGAFTTLTATSVNGLTLTANATGFSVAGGTTSKTLTVSNSLTLAGTDSTTMTFPSTSATIARTDAANTFTGHQTIEGVTSTGATGTGNLVYSASPTLTTPALGTPSALVLTNATGLPLGGGGTGQTTALAARNAVNKGDTALTDAATIATDCATGNVFTMTLITTGRTMGAPTNLAAGATYIWRIKQDATGGRTLTWASAFKWPGGTAPTQTSAANALDVISGVSDGTSVFCSFVQDVR